MTQKTLKAITQEMLMIGCSAGTIRNLWSAIEDRHRLFGYQPPLAMRGGDFSRYSKAVASVKGTPSRLIFPVGVHHVQNMLDLIGLTITQRRDMLMCALGTVMCMRVNEVDQLQICDVLWRFDAGFHAMYANTLACRIYKRKQDTARKGLYPRAGGAIFTRLRAYTHLLGIEGALARRTMSHLHASLPENPQQSGNCQTGVTPAGHQRRAQHTAHDRRGH